MKKLLLILTIFLVYSVTFLQTNAESVSCSIPNWSWTKTVTWYNAHYSSPYDCWDCWDNGAWTFPNCSTIGIWMTNICDFWCRVRLTCTARSYSTCTVVSCNSWYIQSGNTCISSAVNGWWTSWSYGSRGSCDSSTWKEERTWARSCTNPTPSWWWSDCSWSTSITESRNCDVDGWWTSWSYGLRWSCNSSTWNESRTLTRTCTNPSPLNSGSDCSWSTSTTQSRTCVVDGWWTSWNYDSWGTCNSSTWIEERDWTRSCTNPSPLNGGLDCTW
jgi:hypothetical protein